MKSVAKSFFFLAGNVTLTQRNNFLSPLLPFDKGTWLKEFLLIQTDWCYLKIKIMVCFALESWGKKPLSLDMQALNRKQLITGTDKEETSVQMLGCL